MNPFIGSAKQKSSSNPGYKSNYYGITLGVDTLVDEDTILGLSATFLNTKIKHKGTNAGDVSKTNSQVISLYGMQEINDNWFVQGVVSVGFTQSKNQEVRKSFAGGTSVASAKFNTRSYGTEILGGRHFNLSDNSVLTGLFGAEYTRLAEAKYQETGAAEFQNVSVKRRAIDKAEIILGAKYIHSYAINDMIFRPELHGFIRHDLLNRPVKIDARIEGLAAPSLIPSAKETNQRIFYDLGVALNIQKNSFEYGVAYDLKLSSKYVGHQGSFKMRVQL